MSARAGERRRINGELAEWDGQGWVAVATRPGPDGTGMAPAVEEEAPAVSGGAADWLPLTGGVIGGMVGAAGGPVGMAAGTALGTAGGEGWRQALQANPATMPMDALRDIAVSGGTAGLAAGAFGLAGKGLGAMRHGAGRMLAGAVPSRAVVDAALGAAETVGGPATRGTAKLIQFLRRRPAEVLTSRPVPVEAPPSGLRQVTGAVSTVRVPAAASAPSGVRVPGAASQPTGSWGPRAVPPPGGAPLPPAAATPAAEAVVAPAATQAAPGSITKGAGAGDNARAWMKAYSDADAEGRRKLVQSLGGKVTYEDMRQLGAYTDELMDAAAVAPEAHVSRFVPLKNAGIPAPAAEAAAPAAKVSTAGVMGSLKQLMRENPKIARDPKLGEKVHVLLDEAGMPVRALTANEAAAATRAGAKTTWVKYAGGK